MYLVLHQELFNRHAKGSRMVPASDKRTAAQLSEEGLIRYRRWEVEEAVRTFRQAALSSEPGPRAGPLR